MLHYGSVLVSRTRERASMFHTSISSRITAIDSKGELLVAGFTNGALVFYNMVKPSSLLF
jgi:hypothetical protein